jgi:hypothetical protein
VTTRAGSLTQPQVVCPHCWHRFYPDEAKFISQHPALFGDPILGENEQQRFAPHEVRKERSGGVLDPKGMKMTERACPQCHLQIPPDLLRKRPCFISVVGAPFSGKTYFLTVMIHELRELITKFGFSLHDADSHEVKAFIAYERRLFEAKNPSHFTYLKKTEETGELYNRVHLAGVDVQLPKPFIFSLRPTTTNIDASHADRLHQSVVIYDNAGEAFEYLKERDATNRATQHLAEADAVFFAYDPLQEPEARERLATLSDDPQLHLAAVSYRQEQVLTETINRIRRHRRLAATAKIDACLCICIQKYDVWRPLLRDVVDSQGQYVRNRFSADEDFPSPVAFDESKGIAGLDIEQVNRVSLIMRHIVATLNPQLVALAESSFRTIRYFPVAALGTSPSPSHDQLRVPVSNEQTVLKVRPDRIRPQRVTTPLLWMLHRRRLIYRTTRPKSRAPEKYPHATVEDARGDLIRVRTPNVHRVLMLDREYAGSTIEEPETGELIWIPLVQAPPAPPPTATPERSAGATGKEKADVENPLRLTINSKRKRKGWFRR